MKECKVPRSPIELPESMRFSVVFCEASRPLVTTGSLIVASSPTSVTAIFPASALSRWIRVFYCRHFSAAIVFSFGDLVFNASE
jgi:hypothetical protein